MMSRWPIILILGVFLAFAQQSWAREWTDNTGAFSLEAEFLAVKDDSVVLKKADGAQVTLPISRLSEADRQYLQTLSQEQIAEPVQNLMRTAKFSASSEWDATNHTAAKAFDGMASTRWNSASGDARGAWLAAQWDEPVTVRQVVVRQAYDRITGLSLQVHDERTGTWRTVNELRGEELKRQKNGRAGRDPNDGSVNPIFVMKLELAVQTKGLRLLVSSVVPMQPGSVSIFEFEALDTVADITRQITPETIAAWRAAGATFRVPPDGVPYFHFREFPAGRIDELPQPEVPFGLSFRVLTGAKFKQLARLNHMQSLSTEHNHQLTVAECKELAKLTQLRSLNLRFTNVNDAALQELAGLKKLHRLDLFFCANVTDAGFKHLAGMQGMQTLNLGFTKVSDKGLRNLSGMSRLQALDLFRTQVTDEGLKELASFKHLQSLVLHDTRVTDAGLKELAALDQLTLLNLHGTQVSDTGLKELSKMTQLRDLNLWGTRITGAGVNELAALSQLESLNLSGPATDAGLTALVGLKRLRSLYLSGPRVTDRELKEIAGMIQLHTLYLDGTSVSDEGLLHLVGLTQLRRLNLSGTQVTDAGLHTLSGLPQLQQIWLTKTQVTDEGVRELKKLLPKTGIYR